MTKRWICCTSTGSGGNVRIHKVRTLVRFVIDEGAFKDLEVIELADK